MLPDLVSPCHPCAAPHPCLALHTTEEGEEEEEEDDEEGEEGEEGEDEAAAASESVPANSFFCAEIKAEGLPVGEGIPTEEDLFSSLNCSPGGWREWCLGRRCCLLSLLPFFMLALF